MTTEIKKIQNTPNTLQRSPLDQYITALFDIYFRQTDPQPVKRSKRPGKKEKRVNKLKQSITRIITQDRAITVFWVDNTKTTVRCSEAETFDYEKGLAMAFIKKVYGSGYYDDLQELINENPRRFSADFKEKEVKKITDTKTPALTTTKKPATKKTVAKTTIKKPTTKSTSKKSSK